MRGPTRGRSSSPAGPGKAEGTPRPPPPSPQAAVPPPARPCLPIDEVPTRTTSRLRPPEASRTAAATRPTATSANFPARVRCAGGTPHNARLGVEQHAEEIADTACNPAAAPAGTSRRSAHAVLTGPEGRCVTARKEPGGAVRHGDIGQGVQHQSAVGVGDLEAPVALCSLPSGQGANGVDENRCPWVGKVPGAFGRQVVGEQTR